jgi:hypothetical protein
LDGKRGARVGHPPLNVSGPKESVINRKTTQKITSSGGQEAVRLQG